jgi:outer membrane murein-binding lipoprotein Lpp
MTMRIAILGRPVKVTLWAVLLAALLLGVGSRAGEPARKKVEKSTAAYDRMGQASALVDQLRERVRAHRAALQEAEADLQSAERLADKLSKLAVEEWKANSQREYEAEMRDQELRGDRPVPKAPPPPYIGPLGGLQD